MNNHKSGRSNERSRAYRNWLKLEADELVHAPNKTKRIDEALDCLGLIVLFFEAEGVDMSDLHLGIHDWVARQASRGRPPLPASSLARLTQAAEWISILQGTKS